MLDKITIQSHKGPYDACFAADVPSEFGRSVKGKTHVIIDERVAALHGGRLKTQLDTPSVLSLAATEENKSLERFPFYVQHLVQNKIRRGDLLLGIGGGIIQDITCFLAATMLRGIDWEFLPTTLLAQADSCIGSKSSINAAGAKNLLGTFTPPRSILISAAFLPTLSNPDLRSGVGEMIKVHVIDGLATFEKLERDYDSLFQNPETMLRYIHESLRIKKGIIEPDEFDKGIRNVLNYGHSFGHAIEAATHFAIPHGLAVTMGMDFANYVAMRLGRVPEATFRKVKPLMDKNARGFGHVAIPLDAFLGALAKDKKNVGEDLTLILMDETGKPEKTRVPNDAAFRSICSDYLATEKCT